MPLNIPAPGVVLEDANFTTPLKQFVDGVEVTANSALTKANAAQAKADAAYVKPDTLTFPASGTVPVGVGITELRSLTQAQYDALATKSSTTAYFIV